MSQQYRLIWFQHFHKAAGTSIIEIARANGETFYPNHLNGNPLDKDGDEIKLWEYSKDDLIAFIDQCQAMGVTLVSTEWGLPNIEVLSNDKRVVIITCLREPLARFKSNFLFDLHNGFTPARSLETYISSRQRTITMPNYYCRILSYKNNEPSMVIEKDYLLARENLNKFDFVMHLHDGMSKLIKFMKWNNTDTPHLNKTKQSYRTLISLLLHRKWKLLYLRIRFPNVTATDEFKADYYRSNHWDVELLKYSKTQ